MSTKGTMTRDQAAAVVGETALQQLDQISCEPTSRLQTDGDDRVEFAAAARAVSTDGLPVTVTAYYYQEPAALESAGDDLGSLSWSVEGYEVR